MKLQDVLQNVFPSAAVANNQPTEKTSTNNVAFDMLFSDIKCRQQAPAIGGSSQNTHARRDNQSRFQTGESTNTERGERSSRRQSQSRSAESASTSESSVTSEVANAEQPISNNYDYNEICEEQALAAVAAILQIPVEEVVLIMEQLNLDVQDLLDPKVVSQLLQVALGAENPAALLKDPNFPAAYKAINEAMEELAIEAETTLLTGEQIAEAKAQGLQYADMEGLQYSYKDGQLVITNETQQQNSSTSDNATQQATTAETTNSQEQGTSLLQKGSAELVHAEKEVTSDQPQVVNPAISLNSSKATIEPIAKQTAPAPDVKATDVIEQIVSQVKITTSGGNFAEMRLTLRPESLGDIVLRVLTQNGIVTAQFEAESQKVKEMLEANFNLLRNALEEQGIQFSELSVSVRQDGNDQHLNEFERGRQNTRHRMNSIVDASEEVEEPQIVTLHNGAIDITA